MLKVGVAVALAFAATTAMAADKLLRGPVPAWVKPIAASRPGPTDGEGPPVQILLEDKQLHLGDDGAAEFVRTVTQIRSPLGLAAAGAMSLAWSPDTDTVTVHHVHIRRGAQVIDVLAKQDFTVIRRETNLERAILDGVLSATLQPEGVQQGDVIEIAYTLRRLDPVMQGNAEDTLYGRAYGRADRVHLRAVWGSDREIAWTSGTGLDKPKVRTGGGQTEVVVDMKDVDTVKFPVGAPRRFYPTRDLQFSQFRSWADVAALMAPHYVKASQLDADSLLRAEVERIRKSSPDPKARAGLALQLVEDQVRYLAITLENGGYLPATADDTWRRRFGDCKAKTVLLLALLRELGVEAEAALVNSEGGDGLATRLPGVTAFDHVIVRAVIDGQTYWLDGTRSGDRNVDLLPVPRFGHALPLRASASTLIALTPPPLTQPNTGMSFRIDASRGIDAPAPVRAEMIMAGDGGHYLKLFSSTIPAAERDKALKRAFSGQPWLEPKSVEIMVDPVSGEARLVMEGTAKLDWQPKGVGPRWLLVQSGGLGGAAVGKREPGPGADAPWAVYGHPSWTSTKFEVVLPEAGEGFRIEGADVDRAIAGRAYLRKSKVEKGVATVETSIRTLADEFPNSEAAGASEALKEMDKVRVGIRAPSHYRPTPDDVTSWDAETPKTAGDHVLRGIRYASAGQREKAIADLDRAIALDPKDSYAWANRGNSYFHIGKYELALADYAKALELDPRNYVAVQGQATEAMRARRYADAAAGYGRAADLRPANVFALMQQGRALWLMGEVDRALTVLEQAQKVEPTDLSLRVLRYQIHLSRNRRDKALAEVDDALKERPNDSQLHLLRGAALAAMSRSAEAEAAFARAIALRPTPEAYLTRLRARRPSDVAGRISDVELAEKAGARALPAARAEILGDAGRYDEALRVLDLALKRTPNDDDLAAERVEILVRAGRTAEAALAIQPLRVRATGNASRLNKLCWLGATRNFGLDEALRDCDAALKIEPDSGPIADSRGLVLLRLNRLNEALEAYDLAVKLMPTNPESLYGRGLVQLRLARQADADADFAAARAATPIIDEIFGGWGLRAADAPSGKVAASS